MRYKVIISEDRSYIIEADDISYTNNVVLLMRYIPFNNEIDVLKTIATFNPNSIIGIFPSD